MNQDLSTLWQGRNDAAEQGDTRRLFQIVRRASGDDDGGDPVVLGFASDEGVRRNKGRPGAQGGPAAVRRMMAGLPAHQLTSFRDAGDVVCADGDLEAAQSRLGQKVADLLHDGSRVVVLGGGHEIAWGSFQGLQAHLRNLEKGSSECRPVLIVNLDAHFDLRTSRPANSGTPFDQIIRACQQEGRQVKYACFGVSRLGNTPALYDRADAVGAFYVEDTLMQEPNLETRLRDLDGLLEQAEVVYFTVDLDVLPASVAPGVSAPAPYGVPYSVVEAFARRVMESGKCRLADIAEMNPDYDIDNHTARVAARLAWTLLAS